MSVIDIYLLYARYGTYSLPLSEFIPIGDPDREPRAFSLPTDRGDVPCSTSSLARIRVEVPGDLLPRPIHPDVPPAVGLMYLPDPEDPDDPHKGLSANDVLIRLHQRAPGYRVVEEPEAAG